jgi:hypothetical protein
MTKLEEPYGKHISPWLHCQQLGRLNFRIIVNHFKKLKKFGLQHFFQKMYNLAFEIRQPLLFERGVDIDDS